MLGKYESENVNVYVLVLPQLLKLNLTWKQLNIKKMSQVSTVHKTFSSKSLCMIFKMRKIKIFCLYFFMSLWEELLKINFILKVINCCDFFVYVELKMWKP